MSLFARRNRVNSRLFISWPVSGTAICFFSKTSRATRSSILRESSGDSVRSPIGFSSFNDTARNLAPPARASSRAATFGHRNGTVCLLDRKFSNRFRNDRSSSLRCQRSIRPRGDCGLSSTSSPSSRPKSGRSGNGAATTSSVGVSSLDDLGWWPAWGSILAARDRRMSTAITNSASRCSARRRRPSSSASSNPTAGRLVNSVVSTGINSCACTALRMATTSGSVT